MKRAQRDEYLALAQRTQADFENYRKRVARDAAPRRSAGRHLAKECCRRSTTSTARSRPRTRTTRCCEGVRLVRAELGALARAGIESFGPPASPSTRRATRRSRPPSSRRAGATSGTVVEVYQHGYRLGSSILRPARVFVAA